MGFAQSRVVLAGLSAAAAFGIATAMATTTAATARADDIVTDVSAIETAANTAFGLAETDLGSPATEAAGLTQLFIGLDDDLIGIPNYLEVALTDELQGVAVIPPTDFEIGSALPFDFSVPTSLAESVTEANTVYTEGATTLVNMITALPTADLADSALLNAQSVIDEFILPGQIELIGNLAFAGL